VDGRRVVSEAGFKELLTPQIRVSAEAEYGLGWGLAQWRGTRLITHTGGTDGFSALVDLLPDRHAGFVFLNNVPDLQLIKEIRAIVWEHLLDLHQ
jgi:CubicO group peptidase (beta-lactamase class C family)